MAEIVPDIRNNRITKTDYDLCREIGYTLKGEILNEPVPHVIHQMFGIIIGNQQVMTGVEYNRIAATFDLKGLN